MNAPKHTPGPWVTGEAVDIPERFATVFSGEPLGPDRVSVIADVRQGEGRDSRANARLIAAAPDMLEALRDVLLAHSKGPKAVEVAHGKARDIIAKIDGPEDAMNEERKALDMAEAVIRKSTGEGA